MSGLWDTPAALLNLDRVRDIVLCMSTIDPLAARRVSEQLAQKGVAMLDAPVSGGTHGAAAGTLSAILVDCIGDLPHFTFRVAGPNALQAVRGAASHDKPTQRPNSQNFRRSAAQLYWP
jgi:hypothetical protein